MTRICLSEALAILDEHRGVYLKRIEELKPEYKYDREAQDYTFFCKDVLRLLNLLKKEFSNLSDADQLPLGV